MRKAILFALCVFAVGLVGCSGEAEPEQAGVPTGAGAKATKDGATVKGPELKMNPNYDGGK